MSGLVVPKRLYVGKSDVADISNRGHFVSKKNLGARRALTYGKKFAYLANFSLIGASNFWPRRPAQQLDSKNKFIFNYLDIMINIYVNIYF